MIALLCLASFVAGFGLGCLVLWSRRGAMAERLRAAAAEGARLGGELAAERAGRAEAAATTARLGAELAGERAAAEARISELRSAHERVRQEFAELSAAALRTNRDDFLKLAEQSFTQLQEKSAGDLTNRQQAIDAVVKPLKESLEKVDAKINELEQRRASAYSKLGEQLESLGSAQLRMHSETTKLSNALSTTRTAGTWGEVQLRRVIELSGMMEHCDFEEQTSLAGESGRLRPDVIVRLPEGQSIVVDAKAPTGAYREAVAEADPAGRLAKLKEHAATVRGHIQALGSKDYWSRLHPSPEYVVLFLPGDSFLSAAIESDPAIMDDAIRLRVLLATPMTLIALLKAAHYGWNRDAISKNAEEISALGRDLHDRLATFMDHLGSSAKGLSAAVLHFNRAIGNLETRLMPGAVKLAELGAKGAKELTAPEHIELEVREVVKRP